MFFKRLTSVLLSLFVLIAIAIGVREVLIDSKVKIPFAQTVVLNSLTNLPGSDGPILVVKIDDTTLSHPQVGLKSADVVYIEQVEGGLTRLAALFSSNIPVRVGPVRSARISDLELLAQYGKVGFAFSGAQRKLLPEIAAANIYDLGAMKYGPQYYANDPNRNPPYAMMLNGEKLVVDAQSRGATIAESAQMGWTFGELIEPGTKISAARITWPAASYDATWSEAENRWLLSHDGSANLDEDGFHLGVPTFVVQLVTISDSIYKDKVGGVTPFSATVGSGKCYILRDGSYVEGIWNRIDQDSPTTFTDLMGGEIPFASGQIWFALTSKEPVFTRVSNQDATSLPNK